MKALTKQFKITFRLQQTGNKTNPIQCLMSLGTKDGDKYLRVIAPIGITLKPTEWNSTKGRPVDSNLNLKLNILEDVIMTEMKNFDRLKDETIIEKHAEGFFKKMVMDNIDEIIHEKKSRAESLFDEYGETFNIDKSTAWYFVKKAKYMKFRIVDDKGNIISPESFFHNEKESGAGSTAPEGTNPTFPTMTLLAADKKEIINKKYMQVVQGEGAKYTLPANCVLFSDLIKLVGKDKIEERELTSDAKDAKYKTLANKLDLWNDKLTIAEYTDKVATQFTKWLKDNSKTTNTLGNYITPLKAVLIHAQVKYKILTHVETRDSIYDKQQEQVRQPYLNFQQLEVLQSMKFEDKNLEIARDLALISSHTGGSRFSDWNQYFQLQTEVVDGKLIDVIARMNSKTGTETTIPVQPFIVNIIKKYDGSFPELEDGTFNEHIRTVCKLAGEIEPSFLSEYVYHRKDLKTGKPEPVKVEDENGELTIPKLYMLMGSHSFRRSFCTNYYNMGIDADTLREFTSQSLNVFMSYVKSNNKDKMKKFVEKVF